VDSRNDTASRARKHTSYFSTQQAGSNGLLRAAGPGKAVAARSSSSRECDEEEKQIDFEALKNTS